MKSIQYFGLVLGAISIATQQLTGQLPQYATYLSIVGTVASALLVALHHQSQADEPAAKPEPIPITLPSAQLPAALPAQPANTVFQVTK